MFIFINKLMLLDRIELTAFSGYSNEVKTSNEIGTSKKVYLELGDIIHFNYFSRKIDCPHNKERNYLILNPYFICAGFENDKVYGINLSLMNYEAQGSTELDLFYTNYKQVYYTRGERNNVNIKNRNSFNYENLKSGKFGGSNIIKFFDCYRISKMKNRYVRIINIDEARKESSYGHEVVPSNYKKLL
jgi:hypothetical protein